MSDLTTVYEARLIHLLGHDSCTLAQAHSTRLRLKIEAYFPQLISMKVGREYQLIQDKTNFLNYAENENTDEDAIACMRFVKRLRQEISKNHCSFSGAFEPKCQEKSVPPVLLAFVEELLYGSSSTQKSEACLQPALYISQYIVFNYCQSDKPHKPNRLRKKKNTANRLFLYILD